MVWWLCRHRFFLSQVENNDVVACFIGFLMMCNISDTKKNWISYLQEYSIELLRESSHVACRYTSTRRQHLMTLWWLCAKKEWHALVIHGIYAWVAMALSVHPFTWFLDAFAWHLCSDQASVVIFSKGSSIVLKILLISKLVNYGERQLQGRPFRCHSELSALRSAGGEQCKEATQRQLRVMGTMVKLSNDAMRWLIPFTEGHIGRSYQRISI